MGGCASKPQELAKLKPVFLPSDDPMKDQRPKDLEAVRKEYFWTYSGAATPFVKDIPKREEDHPAAEHSKSLVVDVVGQVAKLGFNKGLDMFTEIFKDEGPFDDWSDLYPMCEKPAIASRWRNDEEFARQRINGTLGSLIKRITVLPENFPVTNEIVAQVLKDGEEGDDVTLETLLAAKKVYLCDYVKLDGLPSPADRHALSPLALFYVNKKDKLMPLAIQLSQKPSEDFPIFTPSDPEGIWLAAKIHVQVSDVAVSEMAVHLAQTHLLPEAVYVSAMRQLHKHHPINQFLDPHFWYTMIINDGGRSNLLLEGNSIPRLYALGHDGVWGLLAKEMTTCHWSEEFNMPKQIENRDVGDLKNYFWRDDSLKVWAVYEEYCKGLVNDWYKDDEQLAADIEVQAWFDELVGAPLEEKGCGLLGLPVTAEGDKKMTKKDDLALFLTELIYLVSASHAAVNNGQFDLMGFVPNKPQTFKLAPPKSKNESDAPTLKEIASALPGFANSTEQIALMHVLSKTTDDPIASYEPDFFKTRPSAKPLIDKFKSDLEAVGKDIDARNKKATADGEIPYHYLHPKQIAQSCAI